ncbi:MAG: YkgJ family cysteine cluster protein [Asgard group archaeon]|nr:YkgJ family cysteine cluster protein [Asgard group archaeon]
MTEKTKEKKEKEEKKEEEVKETPSEKKPSKFKFECTKCGECCHNRDSIPVTFNDLAKWTKQGSFMNIILPHLDLRGISEEDELGKLALIPYIIMKDVDENGKGTCPFYDSENKVCNIYFTLPIYCKTFPLSYNGQKFYISDPTCEGIGKGNMTKETLQEMRNTAMRDFQERADTSIAMVPLQGLFIRHFMKQSQQTVERLSDEEKQQLDELIKKSQEPENKDSQ